MFTTRLLTALVGFPLAIFIAYLGGWYLIGLMAVLTLLGQTELFAAARKRGCSPNAWLAGGMGLVLLSIIGLDPDNAEARMTVSVVAVMLCMSVQIIRRSRSNFADIGVTLLGFFWVAWLMGYVLLVRGLRPDEPTSVLAWRVPFGWAALLYLFCVTWLTDTGAFAVGKSVGRRKLCPTVSPGKTVEGSYGALLTAVLTSLLIGPIIGLPVEHSVVLGLIFGIVGQLGDLAKSVLKREAGIKDFGRLFPGHGGVLDRFDALLFNAVVLYYYLKVLVA